MPSPCPALAGQGGAGCRGSRGPWHQLSRWGRPSAGLPELLLSCFEHLAAEAKLASGPPWPPPSAWLPSPLPVPVLEATPPPEAGSHKSWQLHEFRNCRQWHLGAFSLPRHFPPLGLTTTPRGHGWVQTAAQFGVGRYGTPQWSVGAVRKDPIISPRLTPGPARSKRSSC